MMTRGSLVRLFMGPDFRIPLLEFADLLKVCLG